MSHGRIVRMFLVVVAACGVPGCGSRVATTEEEGIAFVEKLNGVWRRDDNRPGKPVVEVSLMGSPVTDEQLKNLLVFPDLAILSLNESPVTGGCFQQLAPFQHLTMLSLGACRQINDAALANLTFVPTLQRLNLGNTHITDAGLKELAKLPQLQHLGLAQTTISDAGLKELANFKHLTMIDLTRTKSTAAGIRELRKALPQCNIDTGDD